MIIWNYYDIILTNILYLLLIFIQKSNLEKCFCYLNSTIPDHNNSNYTYDKKLIQCSLTQSHVNYSHEMPCQRLDKFIRIGPYTLNNSRENLSISPWAFSNLFVNNLVDTLQLDINITTNKLNALSLAGMDGLKNLLARTSLITWDSCSLSGLTGLREVTLNCKANFSEFLKFPSSISVIRFVDCEGMPLQFYCIKCVQDPSVNLIRIRPGPPLRQHLVKFTRFSSLNGSENQKDSSLNKLNLLPLDSCIYDVCSDEMLCRNNIPLNQAKAKIGQPERPVIEVLSGRGILITNTLTEVAQSAQINTSVLNNFSTPISTQYINTTSLHDIMVLTKFGSSKTNHRQKLWIVSAILILIILFIITLGILIVINHQRKLKHKVKCSRSNKSCSNNNNNNNNMSNGKTAQHDALFITEDGNRIELPEIVT